MVRALLIDDEPDGRYLVHKFLNTYFEDSICIIGEASGYESGVSAIHELKPDLIFLDIQMPDGSGFDVLLHFRNPEFKVIFVTAYDSYAIQAFEFSAVGYLMKPLNPETFKRTVSRVLLSAEAGEGYGLKVLLDNHSSGQMNRVILPGADGFSVAAVSEIVFIRSERNYSEFVFADGSKYLSSKNLGYFDRLFANFSFYRVHQSFLVNILQITQYNRSDSTLTMCTGDHIPVARQKKADLMKYFLG